MAAEIDISVGPNQRLPEYAARVVARRAERLAFFVERASRNDSEDIVHKLRVAARRLGSALEAFADHFPANGLSRVAKQAKHLRCGAGGVRNHDIALALASEVGLQLNEKAIARIERGRREASEDLRDRLEQLKGKSPAAEWARALRLTGQSRGAAGPVAASYAAALLPKMANEFFEAGHEAVAPAATVESLHAFRILGKRFRYTLELFSPCYSEGLEDALQLLRGIQDTLGMINDCETAEKILGKAVGRSQREQVKTLLIEQRQAALIENFRSHWNETFAAEGECLTWMQLLAKPAFSPASETGATESPRQAAAS